MNIYVVTGGFGFLGQNIVREILKNDTHCRVKIVARTKDEKSDLLKDNRVEFISADLASEKKFLFIQNATFVIHSAALVSFDPKDKEKMFALNVTATLNIARACRHYSVKRLVYVSSISAVAVSGIKGKPADETSFNMPSDDQNFYTQSKALAELQLHKIAKDIDYVVGCPSVIMGPGDKKINSILKLIVKLPIIPMTAPMWSTIDVRDCAKAFYFLLQQGAPQQRYIITSTHLSLARLAKLFVAALKKKTIVVTLPSWLIAPFKVFNRSAVTSAITDKEYSNEKLLQLGFRFSYPIEQTVADIVKSFEHENTSR
jgi:nucleoside-diphosphate-sugar epimerase